ncbi:MAG: pilus assembly protein CpaF [Rhodospirillaceae bacterium]|jgi:pilus assembly protein CpaF|nr:pilus assembly protein CpaF [Rhodospirillaceae bacterium]
MTALSGGEQLDGELSPMNSVLERPDARAGDALRGPRSLDEIFPLRGDVTRSRQMQETWRAFGSEMEDTVRAALDKSRSPPEIAYAIGGIVHNYFRTRGVTLTSYELRGLVAELLTLRQRAEPEPPLVAFTAMPPADETSWTGDEPGAPGPVVPDVVFEGPPSPLVDVAPRDSDAVLLAAVTARARAELATTPEGRFAREAAASAIDAALSEVLQGEPERRERLARLALSELCGLGPIDRIWADPSIRAVFVDGPTAIHVERNGVLEPSPERFRDQAHLAELVGRLVRRSSSDAVLFRLRDGGEGMVIFPPAAPAGPVLVLRRGEPGNATFERLIAAGTLDRSMADLLRIAARCRLNVLVVGPANSGKTALLAALARDLSDARVVTLARHREFRRPQASKVELVVSSDAAFATLLAAAAQLRPDLLIVDAVRRPDAPALTELLSNGGRGTIAALEPQAAAGIARRAIDLVVHLGRRRDGLFGVVSIEDTNGAQIFVHEDGRFHRRTKAPSFAGLVHKAGYGVALSSALS